MKTNKLCFADETILITENRDDEEAKAGGLVLFWISIPSMLKRPLLCLRCFTVTNVVVIHIVAF